MTDFIAIDTTHIQTTSLQHFMGGLDYQLVDGQFQTKSKGMRHMAKIAFHTAVQLHNLGNNEWIEDKQTNSFSPKVFNGKQYKQLDMHLSGYALQQLQARRLVKQVKLQVSKGDLITQSFMVKPQTPFITRALGLTK